MTISLLGGLIFAARAALRSGQSQPIDQTLVDTVADQVSAVRQLPWKAKVTWRAVSPEEMKSLLREKAENITDEERADLAALGELLKYLRLFPPQTDIAELYMSLVEEGTVGFFDPDTDELFVRTSPKGLSLLDRVALAHELAHALVNQHFDLKKLQQEVERAGDSERSAAFHAFVEGDASLVMIHWASRFLSSDDVRRFVDESQKMATDGIDSAPRIVRAWLEFPYTQGVEFARALQEAQGWKGLDAAYSRLPISTKEIMHPEVYIDRVSNSARGNDTRAGVAPPPPTPGCKTIEEGVIGELDLSLMLQEFVEVSVAERAADGWAADRYRFEECGGKKLFRAVIQATGSLEAAELSNAWSQWIAGWSSSEGNYPLPSSFVSGLGGGESSGRGSTVSVILADDLSLVRTITL